jgi:hypothetical protein
MGGRGKKNPILLSHYGINMTRLVITLQYNKLINSTTQDLSIRLKSIEALTKDEAMLMKVYKNYHGKEPKPEKRKEVMDKLQDTVMLATKWRPRSVPG